MSIVIGGLGSRTGVLVTWGYGDLIVKIISPFTEIIGVKFNKLNSKDIKFETSNNITSIMERVISEFTNNPVQNPSGGDLQIIPTVSVSFDDTNKINTIHETLNAIDALISRVISEEPIVQVINPSSGDLQIIPTVSILYEKEDGTKIDHEIFNKIGTKFIRIIAEEV